MRGNWQRRVERTEARRKAEKLRKEQRRSKRNSGAGGGDISDYKASYGRLEEWLNETGDHIGVAAWDDNIESGAAKVTSGSSCITIDFWTDARPQNRPEYLPSPLDDGINHGDDFDDEDDRNKKGRSKGKQQKEKHRGGFKKSKGKAHPNAKNKSGQEVESVGGGRNRSGSTSQNHQQTKDERLCGQEFFFGKDKCKGSLQKQKGGRKRSDSFAGRKRSDSFAGEFDSGCAFQHYHQIPKVKRGHPSTQPMTLAQVLSEKFQPHHIHTGSDDKRPLSSLPAQSRDHVLKSSFDAAVKDANDTSCLSMIYHSRYSVENKAETKAENDDDSSNGSDSDVSASGSDDQSKDDNQTTSNINKSLREILDKENLPATSLIYLTIQGVLVYDRNRGGLIFSEKEERFLLFGDAIEYSPDDDVENEEDGEPLHIHEQLNHHLLDEILSYCDDESSSTLPQVCTSWRDEVGTRDPQLWKMLLNRHGWPMNMRGDENEVQEDILEQRRQSRDTFISHYTAVRDVRAAANACNYLSGSLSENDKLGLESAVQVFKATKGAPVLDGEGKNRCTVKIWSEPNNERASTRALVAYEDCTLRLYEVVKGSSISNDSRTKMNCRQVVCVRAAPPSVSQKKDSCDMMSMDLDEEKVACLVEESTERRIGDEMVDSVIPWMTIFSREELVCAGNEGLLDDDSIQSHDLRASVLDVLLSEYGEGSVHDELCDALHSYLAMSDEDTSDVNIMVSPKLVACGKGYFLFHAFIHIPGYTMLRLGDDGYDASLANASDAQGHRLFIFSSRSGSIEKSFHLERYREGTSLFASRPIKRRTDFAVCTNILISGPTMALCRISVEAKRDQTIDIVKKSMIENEEFAPWGRMDAALSTTHAIYSTDPVHGPVLYFQKMPSSNDGDENNGSNAFQSIEIGGRDSKVHSMFMIRDQYVAVILGTHLHNEGEENEFDGHWFGPDDEASSEVIIYHVSTRQEIFRCPLPSEPLTVESLGHTLALSVSKGFVMTGENARDVARNAEVEDNAQLTSPSGKNPKSKKKRLASMATATRRKKDSFARGMSMRG